MDHEDEPHVSYNGVSPIEIEMDEEGCDNHGMQKIRHEHDAVFVSDSILLKTLLPDEGFSIRNSPIVEGVFTVKLLKFIALTFTSITIMHLLVANVDALGDRDRNLQLRHIWTYEGNLIVFDCVIFFLVGRLWRQRGVDHLGWILPMIACNMYFESQQFFSWLQHSVTLFEMHCIWPWQLWVFVAVLIPSIGSLVLLHVLRAYRKRIMILKIVEIGICLFFFIVPFIGSNYFHLHHWFFGWLLGMHCNFDVWWSRAAMAWCWGMYINGISVYGRDPVLTCEYAYFLSTDNYCPYMQCYIEAIEHKNETHTNVTEMVPANWRNCSAEGFHP